MVTIHAVEMTGRNGAPGKRNATVLFAEGLRVMAMLGLQNVTIPCFCTASVRGSDSAAIAGAHTARTVVLTLTRIPPPPPPLRRSDET